MAFRVTEITVTEGFCYLRCETAEYELDTNCPHP